MKGIIIYESKHHGNTKKLCEEIAKATEMETFDAGRKKNINIADYDFIGLASGIAMGAFYKNVTEIAKTVPSGKKVFCLYTCARNDKNYAAKIEKIVSENGAEVLGEYGCKGFNTFSFLKLIGGINKNNPTQEEINEGIAFVKKVLN